MKVDFSQNGFHANFVDWKVKSRSTFGVAWEMQRKRKDLLQFCVLQKYSANLLCVFFRREKGKRRQKTGLKEIPHNNNPLPQDDCMKNA